MSHKYKSPFAHAGARRAHTNNYNNKFNKKYSLKLDYSLLPDPRKYYCLYFPNIKTNKKWVQVKCPFHVDNIPSLSISMIHGGFRCFGCGAKGGLIKFHMMFNNMRDKNAVTQLGALRNE